MSAFTFLRSHDWVKGFFAGAVGAALVVPAASVIAQVGITPSRDPDLAEYQGMVRECRVVIPETSAQVFATTDQIPSAQIGTFSGGTVVKLTGVFRTVDGSSNMAQVYLPNGNKISVQPVGWVRTDKITTLRPGMRCPQP